MRPLGIHHVALNVSDLGEALAFYTGALGLTVRADRPDFGVPGVWLNAGPGQLHLLGADPAPSLGEHLAIRVEDLGATVDELRSKGLSPSGPAPVGTGHFSFVSDPSGNLVELHQVD